MSLTEISLYISDVPGYLHESAFYRNLNVSGDTKITIPKNCFRSHDTVTNLTDFEEMIFVMRFWCSQSIPPGVAAYLDSTVPMQYQVMIDIYEVDMPIFSKYLSFVHMTSFQRYQWAIQRRRMDMLHFFYRCIGKVTPQVAAEAIEHKYLEAFTFLCELNDQLAIKTEVQCSAVVDLDCLKWLIRGGFITRKSDITALKCAALTSWSKTGNQTAFDLLHVIDDCLPPTLLVHAAKLQNMSIFRILHDMHCLKDASVAEEAARHANTGMLESILSHDYPVQPSAFTAAAKVDNIVALELLHKAGHAMDQSALTVAMEHKHETATLFLITRGCPIPATAVSNAVYSNNVCALKALMQAGAHASLELATTVFKMEKVEMLKIFHEHGVPMPKLPGETYSGVGFPRNYCLKYALQNNFPVDYEKLHDFFHRSTDTELIVWLLDECNLPPCCINMCPALSTSEGRSNEWAVQLQRRNNLYERYSYIHYSMFGVMIGAEVLAVVGIVFVRWYASLLGYTGTENAIFEPLVQQFTNGMLYGTLITFLLIATVVRTKQINDVVNWGWGIYQTLG